MQSTTHSQVIREDRLRDSRHPIHEVADRLLPYLQILTERFQPEQVILFGSYAYGQPTIHSDIDLLVVKPIVESRVKDKVAIRREWWPLMKDGNPLSFDLLLATPEEFHGKIWEDAGYRQEIKNRGLRIA